MSIKWLNSVSDNALDCIAVVAPEGGRRLLPLSDATRRKILNLERSFETTPATVNEFGTERNRLDRYLTAAWEARVVGVASGNFEVRISSPDDAIPLGTKVHVYARPPDVLELTGLPEDLTELMAELKRVAADFPALLDRFS